MTEIQLLLGTLPAESQIARREVYGDRVNTSQMDAHAARAFLHAVRDAAAKEGCFCLACVVLGPDLLWQAKQATPLLPTEMTEIQLLLGSLPAESQIAFREVYGDRVDTNQMDAHAARAFLHAVRDAAAKEGCFCFACVVLEPDLLWQVKQATPLLPTEMTEIQLLLGTLPAESQIALREVYGDRVDTNQMDAHAARAFLHAVRDAAAKEGCFCSACVVLGPDLLWQAKQLPKIDLPKVGA